MVDFGWDGVDVVLGDGMLQCVFLCVYVLVGQFQQVGYVVVVGWEVGCVDVCVDVQCVVFEVEVVVELFVQVFDCCVYVVICCQWVQQQGEFVVVQVCGGV